MCIFTRNCIDSIERKYYRMKIGDIFAAVKGWVEGIMGKVDDAEANDWIALLFGKIEEVLTNFGFADKKIG